jgi:hypothetical protein
MALPLDQLTASFQRPTTITIETEDVSLWTSARSNIQSGKPISVFGGWYRVMDTSSDLSGVPRCKITLLDAIYEELVNLRRRREGYDGSNSFDLTDVAGRAEVRRIDTKISPLCGPLSHDQTLIRTSVVHCPKCNWWVSPDDPAYKLACETLPKTIMKEPREIPRLGE